MKRLVIICDFNKNSGFGHLTRMISFARSLNKKLFEVKFLFETKDKKFVQNYLKDFKCIYLPFSLIRDSKKVDDYLKRNLIDIVVLDSYKIEFKLEKRLYKSFFVVSIDDKVSKHCSHMVFNSREDLDLNNLSKPGKLWFTGRKFILMNKIRKKKSFTGIIKKVLIHAGGSSAYKLIDNFFNTSLMFLSNKNIHVDILYSDKKSYHYLSNKINLLVKNNHKNRLIKFHQNFSKNLYKYDIVVGPAGTTTFETLSSGVLTFSFPLLNDGRDSISTWNLLGNIIHLKFNEKDKKAVIIKMWKHIFYNFKTLEKYIKRNSKLISDNSYNIQKLISKYFNNRDLLYNKFEDKKLSYTIKKAELKFSRFFLESRNSKKVRELSSNPKHIISFPEHLKWWNNSRIKKFVLLKNKSIPSGYHWVKLLKHNGKKIIISGWFLDYREDDNLRASFELINHQKNTLKKIYKGCIWLININKKNILSNRMNKSIGFKNASLESFNTAYQIFRFEKKNFNVYEMNL